MFLIFLSFTIFNIDDAIDYGLKNNKNILSAYEKMKQKEIEVRISLSNFLPSVDFQGSMTRLDEVQKFSMVSVKDTLIPVPVYDINHNLIGYTQPIPVPYGIDTFEIEMGKLENYLLRTTVKQPIFTGGKLFNAYLISRLNYEIEKENYKKQVKNLKIQITQLFYSIIATDKALELLNESYNQTQKHYEQVERLYSNGLASKLDLLNTKTALLNMKTQLLNLQNTSKLLKNNFKLLLSIEDSFQLKSELEYKPFTLSYEEALESAFENSNDLMILKKTREILEKAKNIEISNFLPNIFALFNYDYSKPENFSNPDWGTSWNITIGMSMNVFNGFTKINKIRSKNCDIKQIDFTIAQYEDFLKNEVRRLFDEIEKNKEILDYQKDVISNSEEALKIAESRYINGQITNLEYTDTQILLLQAKTEYLKTLTNYIISTKNMEILIEKEEL
uniref:TolC family protein n=1 Tax=candidate division WOR-3 bacterium TaxID=2052148 RepID=A0A7C4YFX1_UNCW3